MRSLVLFEDEGFVNLLPLTYWRTVFELRVGRRIVLDRAAQLLGMTVGGVWTRGWIAEVAAHRCSAPANRPISEGTVLVNGRWLCDKQVDLPSKPCVGVLDEQAAFIVCDAAAAARLTPQDLLDAQRRKLALQGLARVPASGRFLRYPWDLLLGLAEVLQGDWDPAEASIDASIDSRAVLVKSDRIHIGEGASVHSTAVIDATDGPIIISHDARIGAYSVIEGPAYIGPGTRVNPHSWLHGGNSIGPICKVGGEIDGCVIDGYSNKQHSGFLGHAYVGSWVNLGAGAVNSDLKNTYGNVRVPLNGVPVDTGLRFLGCIIGDHAKLGINATIPTGAVIGFSASVASTRMLPKWIPSFSWVTDDRVSAGDPSRLLDAAAAMMVRRNIDMTDEEVELFLELGRLAPTFERPAR